VQAWFAQKTDAVKKDTCGIIVPDRVVAVKTNSENEGNDIILENRAPVNFEPKKELN
jgi:hypothetical protein